DDFADRAFRNLLHHRIRAINVEKISLRVRYTVKNRELNVDDALVARQHEALRCTSVALPTNIDLLFDDLRLLIGFDRPPMEMQAWFGHFILRLTKAQFN